METITFTPIRSKKWCKYLNPFYCFCKNKNKTSDIEYLVNVVYENTLPFVPPINVGKVIRVYDGDTFTMISKLPHTEGPIYRFSVRMNGIDSPEIKGKTTNEKELAKKSRDALINLILGKIVTLKNVSTEKYGRILADVYIGDLWINEWMLENNFAVKYDGGTKERPEEWN
jgi:endonuclease YncB( thermonuclease family)